MSARILVFDDDDSVRRSLLRLLRARGYVASGADTSANARELVLQLRPAVILMDLLMPVKDGVETTRRLKADKLTADIPIIALTASQPPPTPDDALFEIVLRKPCAPDVLVEAIERARRHSAP